MVTTQTHETCTVTNCDCTCAGCRPSQCAACPKCGADIDNTPQDGGVTDIFDAPSYQGMTTQSLHSIWMDTRKACA